MTTPEPDEFTDIRDAVAKLCAQFPGEYWRKLDREMAYPSAFVDALADRRMDLPGSPEPVS